MINNSKVRVYVESETKPHYYFNIGNLGSFERKLEAAQREMGLDPFDFVTVRYVREQHYL